MATSTQEFPSRSIPFAELNFGETGVADLGPVRAAPAHGDMLRREHGTLVKWPAGFSSSLHTHTHDYFGVVIRGVIVNSHPGEAETPLPPGSCWYQRAGEPHTTKCVSAEDGLFVIYMTGPFDHLVCATAREK